MWQTTKADTKFLGRQYYKCHECRSFKDTKIDIMWRNLGPESLKYILHEIYSSTQKTLTWHLDYGVSRRGWLWWYVFADAAFFSSRRGLPMTTERRLAKLRCCDDDQMFLAHGWKQWLVQKVGCTRLQKQPPVQRDSCARLQTASRTNCVMYTASNRLQYRKCDVHSAFRQMYAAPKSLPYKCLLYTAAKSASRTEKLLYTASNSLLYMNSKKNTNIGMLKENAKGTMNAIAFVISEITCDNAYP